MSRRHTVESNGLTSLATVSCQTALIASDANAPCAVPTSGDHVTYTDEDLGRIAGQVGCREFCSVLLA